MMRVALAAGLFAASGWAAAVEWEPVVEPYNQIFPALELATATMETEPPEDPTLLGDPNSLIGASVVAQRDKQKVWLQIRAPGLIQSAVFEGVLPKAGETYTVYPLIAWDFQALAAFRQPAPASLQMFLKLDGKPVGERAVRVRVRSVNDALYWVGDEESGVELDFNWLFAAYVNEDHPLVDQILAEAVRSGVVEDFSGYQAESTEDVYRQVFAIWYVLQKRGIKYSSITRTSSEHSSVLSQNVRFIDQSWENSQANCVDGTVLFASVLRKIDINPVLVMVPGHAFLGFALNEDGSEMAYLETTMLGSEEDEGEGSLDAVRELLPESQRVQSSFDVFEAAVESGASSVEEAGDKFELEEESEYQMVDVQEAREAGVMPIVPR